MHLGCSSWLYFRLVTGLEGVGSLRLYAVSQQLAVSVKNLKSLLELLNLPWGLLLSEEVGDGISLPRSCTVYLLSLAWNYSMGRSSSSLRILMLLMLWNVETQLSRILCLLVESTARTTSTTLRLPSLF